MNTHANIVFNATCYQQWMQLDSNDVVIGVAPFFHITGMIAHLAVAALAGMPIIIFYRFEPAETLRLIEKWHGSFTVAAITVYIALMSHPDIRTRDLSSFKKAYSGGALVSPAIVENFERITHTYIHNIYGLTETTSPSHAVPLDMRAPVDPVSGALSVGVPIPNTICRVVDVTNGQDLPPIKAAVAQVPLVNGMENARRLNRPDVLAQFIEVLTDDRKQRYTQGSGGSIPVVAPEGEPSALPTPDSYDLHYRLQQQCA